MSENWIEVIASGPWERKDEASYMLIEAGSTGVIEEGNALPEELLKSHSVWEEWEAKEEEPAPLPGTLVSCKAYFRAEDGGAVGRLREDLGAIGWTITSSPFKDHDWATKWKEHIKPVKVKAGGVTIIVKPTWKDVKAEKGDIIIEIDPGMAFGTGEHATTKMCLKAIVTLLEEKGVRRSSILDVGTGTGVLVIAAKKLKVREAVGTDIDRVALEVARKNARLNRTELTLTDKPVERVSGTFPLVVANILASALIRLSGALTDRVRPNGYLVLSGILAEEKDQVKEPYAALGLKLVKTYQSGEWAAMVFHKEGEICEGSL